jgi:acyl carrier protein
MTNNIQKIVTEILKELNEGLKNKDLENPTQDTKLYGAEGTLDSLALVSLIADLEENIFDEFDKEITLADERAMSQRNSPFKSVESLVNYIEKLLEG